MAKRKLVISGLLLVSLLLLAAVLANSFWQRQQVKVQLETIVSAVEPVKVQFDEFIGEKKIFPSVKDMGDMGIFDIKVEGMSYMMSRQSGYGGGGELEVFFSESAEAPLQGQKIIFQRYKDGRWVCVTTVAAQYRPSSCADDAPDQPVYLG